MKHGFQLVNDIYGVVLILLFSAIIYYPPLFFLTLSILLTLVIAEVFKRREYYNTNLYLALIILIYIPSLLLFYSMTFNQPFNWAAYFFTIIAVLLAFLSSYQLANQMRKYDEATKEFRMALKINPNDTTILNNKGAVLVNIGEYNEAMKSFDNVLEIDPLEAAAWHNKGVVMEKLRRRSGFLNLGNYEEVIRHYDYALKLDPGFKKSKKMGKVILEI